MAEQRYNVVGLSRTEPDYLSGFPNIGWFHFDLSQKFNDDEFTVSLSRFTERIDLAIINAATAFHSPLAAIPGDICDRMIATNLTSTIRMLRHLIPIMPPGSQTVFVNSSVEYHPAPNMGLYAALKAAQSHLASTLNVEHFSLGIRFKVLRPCFINTSFARKAGEPAANINENAGLDPDLVADDLIRLTRKNVFMLNSGRFSKFLYVLNRISPGLCRWLSTMKHRERV